MAVGLFVRVELHASGRTQTVLNCWCPHSQFTANNPSQKRIAASWDPFTAKQILFGCTIFKVYSKRMTTHGNSNPDVKPALMETAKTAFQARLDRETERIRYANYQ